MLNYNKFDLVGTGEVKTSQNGNQYSTYSVLSQDGSPVCGGQVIWSNNPAFATLGVEGGTLTSEGIIVQFEAQGLPGNGKRNLFISRKAIEAKVGAGMEEDKAIMTIAAQADNRIGQASSVCILDLANRVSEKTREAADHALSLLRKGTAPLVQKAKVPANAPAKQETAGPDDLPF